ncbi:hypothetical protein KC19_9G129300 [Ceratodon purpureus]|uniref:Uncharacterized protein n=1 Tax=Ceratodon purpureus TaxID=3225 RepID=A0A8T0GTA7_CERPU|nr:hypothetical protein KC19_9G129300 [Ceratodon purpureus]
MGKFHPDKTWLKARELPKVPFDSDDLRLNLTDLDFYAQNRHFIDLPLQIFTVAISTPGSTILHFDSLCMPRLRLNFIDSLLCSPHRNCIFHAKQPIVDYIPSKLHSLPWTISASRPSRFFC